MKQRTQIKAERHIFTDRIALYVRFKEYDGSYSYVKRVEVERIEDAALQVMDDPEPILTLELEEAQRLMDELWNVGLRPSEGSGSAGALAEAQRHIETLEKESAKLWSLVRSLTTEQKDGE